MKTKQVCQLDENGYFVGLTVADESPLEPDVFLFPRNTLEVTPPILPEGKRAKWEGEWVFDDIPPDEPPSPEPPPVVIPYDESRRGAYILEADPLFFKAQRGEATMQEWKDKVAEIKARFPKE